MIGETDLDDWNWVLDINLWGPIHGCHVFAPILRDAGRPAGIINVASAAAFGAAPGMAAYNVSKAGTLSLSETLAAELSGTGVNVTVLCPTFVKTNIVDSGRISARSTQLADQLMRWTGFSPERVARTCLDTHDRGGLYCMPQPDARIGWGIKRFTPTVYTRAVGLTTRVTTLGGIDGDRHGRDAGEDQGPPVGAGRHRLGRTGCRDDHRRTAAQAQGLHGRPVLDREHRRPRLRRAGQEGARPRRSPRSTATSTPRSSGTPTPNWR